MFGNHGSDQFLYSSTTDIWGADNSSVGDCPVPQSLAPTNQMSAVAVSSTTTPQF